MFYERKLIFGGDIGGDNTNDPFDYSDDPYTPEEDQLVAADDVDFDGEVVIPVFARPHAERQRGSGWIDHTAQVITGDVPDELSPTPFESAQMEYEGRDTRGLPSVGYDEVSAENYLYS